MMNLAKAYNRALGTKGATVDDAVADYFDTLTYNDDVQAEAAALLVGLLTAPMAETWRAQFIEIYGEEPGEFIARHKPEVEE